MIFNIGTCLPDFKTEFNNDNFPSELIFDAAAIKQEEGWKQILKPEENFDKFNGEGNFYCGQDFTIGFTAKYDPDVRIEDYANMVPHGERFQVYIVKENKPYKPRAGGSKQQAL